MNRSIFDKTQKSRPSSSRPSSSRPSSSRTQKKTLQTLQNLQRQLHSQDNDQGSSSDINLHMQPSSSIQQPSSSIQQPLSSDLNTNKMLEELKSIEKKEKEKEDSITANKRLQSIKIPNTDPSNDPDFIKFIHISNILKFLKTKSDKELFQILDKYKLRWRELDNQHLQRQIIENLNNEREFSLDKNVRETLINFIRKNLIREINNTREILKTRGWEYNTLSQAKIDKELSINGGRKKTYKRKTQIRRRTRKTTKNLSIRKRKRKTIRKNR